MMHNRQFTREQVLEMHRLHKEEGLKPFQVAKRLGIKWNGSVYALLDGMTYTREYKEYMLTRT
jgi:hypothetical protein